MENKTVNLLNDEDVLSTSYSALMFQCTFKVSEFLMLIQSKLTEEKLFNDGLECEILSPGKSWAKGKVKLRLEFCPDDAEFAAKLAVTSPVVEALPAQTYGPPSVAKDNVTNAPVAVNYATPTNNNIPLSRNLYIQPGSVGMWS